MTNQFKELLLARRSCRKYEDKAVPQELIEQVVEAGRLAPSGSNVQLSHFIVVQTPDKLEAIRACVEKELALLDPETPEHQASKVAINAARKGNYNFFFSAPALILVANRVDNFNFFADSSCAMQNMMLMATELGLGSCWVNQFRRAADPPSLRALLNLAAGEEVCAGLALGYPQKAAPPAGPPKGNPVTFL